MIRKILTYYPILFLLLLTSCGNREDSTRTAAAEYIPEAPDYTDGTMWFTRENVTAQQPADVFYLVSTWESDWTTDDGRTCHYADAYNTTHRANMDKEIARIADYMGEAGDFHSCEPWLYQECLRENIRARVEAYYNEKLRNKN